MHKALVKMAVYDLQNGRLPPRGLNRYFLRAIEDPADFANKMEIVDQPKRGRPSLDNRRRASLLDADPKVFFGRRPSEKHALIVAYLHSIGHPINEASGRNNNRASAVVILAELTGRSLRSLQRDYYLHRKKIEGRKSALDLGQALYIRLEILRNLKAANSAPSR